MRKSPRSWAKRLALTAVVLLASVGARANVVETFNVSGSFAFPHFAFTGTIDLDFTDDFSSETVKSVAINVGALPAFNKSASFSISGDTATVAVTDGNPLDVLTLFFMVGDSGLTGFDQGAIQTGEGFFGNQTGILLGATGMVTREASDPPITAVPDPTPVAAPELSTWAMMLIGLAGLGVAAKRRRAIGLAREAISASARSIFC